MKVDNVQFLQAFGTFNHAPKMSDSFYGTGESFLFSCDPEFKVYSWTGDNNFFIKGYPDYLVTGGGE